MIKVTLREKKISKGRKTLYLDFYPPIVHPLNRKATRHLTLKLYVYARPKNSDEKTHNDETRLLAQGIRAKRQLEVQAGAYDFLVKSGEADFLAYFKESIDKLKSKSNKGIRQCAYNHFAEYAPDPCPFSLLNEKFLEKYKEYLLDTQLLHNTVSHYLAHLKAVIKSAVKDRILAPVEVEQLGKIETEKHFLSLDELKALANTEFPDFPELRTAGLFSAMTGLRFSDVSKLLWDEVHYSKELGWHIRFMTKKTGVPQTVSLSDETRELLGEGDGKVFKELNYDRMYKKLPSWLTKAGVKKHFTFHCFRHTYSVLQLTLGTDIYTLSKLLGHQSVTHTQIYAKIVDEKKREAANRISLK